MTVCETTTPVCGSDGEVLKTESVALVR